MPEKAGRVDIDAIAPLIGRCRGSHRRTGRIRVGCNDAQSTKLGDRAGEAYLRLVEIADIVEKSNSAPELFNERTGSAKPRPRWRLIERGGSADLATPAVTDDVSALLGEPSRCGCGGDRTAPVTSAALYPAATSRHAVVEKLTRAFDALAADTATGHVPEPDLHRREAVGASGSHRSGRAQEGW